MKKIETFLRCIGAVLLGLPLASTAQTVPIYSYVVPSAGGYAANGNLLQVQDSVNGSWTYSYDVLNRLVLGTSTGTNAPMPYTCWSYDSFGNRTNQVQSSAPISIDIGGVCTYAPNSATSVNPVTYGTNNRIMSMALLPQMPPDAYDGGNVQDDGNFQYVYDEESRLCAIGHTVAGIFVGTQYVYDAEGRRVAKGAITSLSCDRTTNGFQASSSLTSIYILDQSGNQVSEVDGQGNWKHTNVFMDGTLLATYDSDGLHFNITDPLGTKRVQASGTGQAELNCASLPFGDGAPCAFFGANPEATEHRYTGKERDTESGLDYFGARYYASNMGRFMSPDPIQMKANRLADPQRLNLYNYAVNNPLGNVDPDGRDAIAIAFSNYHAAASGVHIPFTGHGAVITVDSRGHTRMFEYGRYDHPKEKGIVREVSVPNLVMKDGAPTDASLKNLMGAVAAKEHGYTGEIQGDYFKTTDKQTGAMNAYAQGRENQNSDPNRPDYNTGIVGDANNCATFCRNTVGAGGVDTSAAANDIKPTSTVEDLQKGASETFTYDATKKTLDVKKQPQ